MASDADLLQRWRDGDGAAGNQLFQRRFATVFRFFVNKTCSLDDTEELTRRTFLELMSARDRLPGGASLVTYTLGVANGVLARYHRGLAHSNEHFDPLRSSILELGAGAETQLECIGAQRLLLVALREIPAELQIVLELYYVEELESGRDRRRARPLRRGRRRPARPRPRAPARPDERGRRARARHPGARRRPLAGPDPERLPHAHPVDGDVARHDLAATRAA